MQATTSKKESSMKFLGPNDLTWRGDKLCRNGSTRPLIGIEPDSKYPDMWRVRLLDGSVSDMLSRRASQASPYGLAARDGLAATVATCRPGGTHGPAMPDSRHKLRNAGQVFATNRETKIFAAKYA